MRGASTTGKQGRFAVSRNDQGQGKEGKAADEPGLTGVSAATEEKLGADQTEGAAAAQLRETARLSSEVKYQKARNLRAWSVAGLMAIGNILLLGSFLMWFPKYRYVATADNAAICEVQPGNNSRVSPAAVMDYAREAVLDAYSYDYVNYRDTINAVANRWFTEAGRQAFFATLDASGNLERVVKGRLILKSSSLQVPQIEEEGMTGVGMERYWLIHIPIVIEFYRDGRQETRQQFLAAVTVIQQPASATNLKGIAVDSIQLSPWTQQSRN